jgi:hypothetical protein
MPHTTPEQNEAFFRDAFNSQRPLGSAGLESMRAYRVVAQFSCAVSRPDYRH